MSKRWKIRPFDSEQVCALEKAAGVPAILAQLFFSRDVTDPQAVRDFMSPKLSSLRSPQDLPGCAETAERLFDAIQAKRKITVYGDYDVDGMTGTAILTKAIRILGGDVNYYVPNRLDEGYGLSNDSLKSLADEGTKLLITVDCGISSCEEAKTAKELGVELLITDHHMPGPELPDVLAIAHPQLLRWDGKYHSAHSELMRKVFEECQTDPTREKPASYPFTGLSGAMVALKVAWALGQISAGEQKVSPQYRDFLVEAVGLATLGTIADVVPLIDENRYLVKHGLDSAILNHSPLGIQELIRVAGIKTDKPLSSETIGFQLTPRLNAVGRLGQARLGIELLLTSDAARAKELAEYIHNLNDDRQKLERTIQKEAIKQIMEQYSPDDPAFVLASTNWHSGVIGIVAGRLSEQYNRPVIMISMDKMGLKPASGSARGIPGFNLYDALEACQDHLVRFGGHASAAGLGVTNANLGAFREAFVDYAATILPPEMRAAELLIDAEYPFGTFTLQTVQQIEQMAPFGCGNRRPILCTTKVYLDDAPKTMGADNRHFAATFLQDGISFRAVAFSQGQWVEQMAPFGSGPFDIAFHVVINTFAGRSKVELHLQDWRPS
ncbi:MAG: DHHA1 domain-containing protein [Planctomycetaceae bacterium]|nr:DHHA1 domain-containing protein [Planctomycetaceae bacterium]